MVVFRVGGWSPQLQSKFLVFRPTLDTAMRLIDFVYGTITLYGGTFQFLLLSINCQCCSPQPPVQALGLPLSPFARRYLGNLLFDFSSSWYLDVSVPKVRSPQGDIYLYMPGCPIQKSTDQSFLAAPRGLSQPSTSFIASISQGIHH